MLYIISTPIGNLEDITLRALRVLREVDFILCEDTRVTKKLLAKYEIKTPTVSYHQHSAAPKVEKIIELLKQGKNLALVTDAGTPGIADPGNELIHKITETRLASPARFAGASARRAGGLIASLRIIPIPGPSAVAAALSIAGVPTSEFLFLGFLPHKKGRQTLVKKIVASERTAVVYESCHRIVKFLQELIDNLPLRQAGGGANLDIVVCRELTKMFESVYRGTPAEVLAEIQKDKNNLKGEFVIVIGK
ncbi:rRNA (cytidine-2'-O-)-methyltransferase [Candidatus Falkowbacteria bacterium CG10_big_fil_rev_8_21_14_0_10_44_15]|uniref:Ribosomal RNA small subunit methyltransferase I n=1 Tax=Candidatus Falkowbacteria bacterium CG10_big_fil_rev_8_21_14_0_10_44_15 TaxID=1974569 RepID=A0A2H0V067_9BACT|nr:MAG: rRNA (cytidine-2'-O-)-methyltransferase [Candidatus Falkowbacteria bacterium CG10_big_fil_rev_8_21_14_0_10_44_15]